MSLINRLAHTWRQFRAANAVSSDHHMPAVAEPLERRWLLASVDVYEWTGEVRGNYGNVHYEWSPTESGVYDNSEQVRRGMGSPR